MPSSTIKIFLVHGDPKRLKTVELSNWTGKGVAGSRAELTEVLAREESQKPGVYVLTGVDPQTEKAAIYIGEAENIGERLKPHLAKDYWNHVAFFVSKDENLTKSHIRFLEGRLIEEAKLAGRYLLKNNQASGAKLPECDREDMETFLEKIRQLLPVLGIEALVPRPNASEEGVNKGKFFCEIKHIRATGYLTPNGIVVTAKSQAVLADRNSTKKYPWAKIRRAKLIEEGILKSRKDHLVFTQDHEFTSPSAAASVIHGGQANGLTAWKNAQGKTLKSLESK